MSHSSPADDLVRLWQASVQPAPDPARLTDQLARMAVRPRRLLPPRAERLAVDLLWKQRAEVAALYEVGAEP
jgi:hypothetical protein